MQQKTHIGKEHAGDAALGVHARSLWPSAASLPPCTLQLVARDAVLVRLDAAVVAVAEQPDADPIRVRQCARPCRCLPLPFFFPAERQVGRRHDLEEVHVVERDLGRVLLGAVERVDVVVRPVAAPARGPAAADAVAERLHGGAPASSGPKRSVWILCVNVWLAPSLK